MSSSGTTCDGYGASATYSETIDSSGSVAKRSITASGCPNHYNLCTGKDGSTGCGGLGEEGTATEAAEQDLELDVPASPVLRDSFGVDVAASECQCTTDPVGVALNGVGILNGAVGSTCTEFLDVDDNDAEWISFDCCSGHTRSFEGAIYHYHFPPSCLMAQIGDFGDGHSPQIGWANDGFPIYGPKGPAGIDMTYTSTGGYGSCTGDYCLDQCGGLEAELSGVDNFKYRYYMVGAASDLATLPSNPKPSTAAAAIFASGKKSFSLNCYRGYLYSELEGGSTGTSGVTDAYSASATTGVTDTYAPSGLCVEGAATSYTNGLCSTSTDSSCNAAYDGVGSDGYTSPSPSPSPSPTPTPSASPSPSPSPSSSGSSDGAIPMSQAGGLFACAIMLSFLGSAQS